MKVHSGFSFILPQIYVHQLFKPDNLQINNRIKLILCYCFELILCYMLNTVACLDLKGIVCVF